jgi:hypothetical protein
LPAAYAIAATYKPAGWKPALHETITFVTGNESCGAVPIARPGNALTPGRRARTAPKRTRCFAEAISEQFAAFIWDFASRVFRNGCMCANLRRAPGPLDPSNRELSIEYRKAQRPKCCGSTHDPGSPGQIRRTRGVTPAQRSETPNMKSNGHDTSTSRVNGHGPVSPSHTAQEVETPFDKGRAASDDARDFPSAAGATSAPTGKERDACAEVAPSLEGETKHQPKPKKSGKKAGRGAPPVPSDDKSDKKNDKKKSVYIPPGSKPLPADGAGFVDAMHAHVDLYLACARLVKSGDEKIAQRMVERLLEMSYGKSPAPVGDEMPQIIFDAPRLIED